MTFIEKTAAFVVALLLLGLFAFALFNNSPAEASVSVTNEYQATSTAASTVYGATITGDQAITATTSPRLGSLGSVIILGANTGVWHLYDATTTNVNLRTGNKATSTILLASFPASLAAGTYTFDVEFVHGLLLDHTVGNMPTSTITYR